MTQRQFTMPDGTVYRMQAWTGGNAPLMTSTAGFGAGAFVSPISDHYSLIRNALYREQFRTFAGYWGEGPDADARRIFWNRACHDAWRTVCARHGK